MRTRRAGFLTAPSLTVLLGLLAAVPGAARSPEPPGSYPARVAVEHATAAGLELAVEAPFESARLTLRRIGGEVVHRGTYTSTPIPIYPRVTDAGQALPDGVYVYELVVLPPEEAEPEAPGAAVVSDLFEIRAGGLVPKGETAAEAPRGPTDPSGNVLATRDSVVTDDLIVEGSVCASDSDVCGNGETFLTPLLLNAQLKLKDSSPLLWLADSTSGHDDWVLRADAGTLRIQNADTEADAIFIEEGVRDNAIYVTDGKRIGLFTSNPSGALHIANEFPSLHLQETIRLATHFSIFVGTLTIPSTRRVLQIHSHGPFKTHLSIDQDTGGVGLGTATPTASLDIAPSDGLADLRLASGDAAWRFTSRGQAITVSRDGSEGRAVEIRDRLDAAGPTLVVDGSIRGTHLVNTSSREHKTGFEDVDPAALLAALGELPITAWRYRHEPEGTRHVGPVAEDFRARFGLGDGETISTVDALGVLMAAVQALHAETTELRQRIAELEP